MNIIVANRQLDQIKSLNLDDIMKIIEGEFTAEEIVSQLKHLFAARYIIDVTAIKNYKDINTLKKLSISLPAEKIILLLDPNFKDSRSAEYLTKLISINFYNFTDQLNGIPYLISNPNSYVDVAHIQQLEIVSGDTQYIAKPTNVVGPKIIGFKNLNSGAGSTSLVYMLTKQCEKYFPVIALEVDKRDFSYFNYKKAISVTSNNIGVEIAKNQDKMAIFIDLNHGSGAEALCHEVYYLLQPSMIKLNKFIGSNPNVLKEYRDKKIILNQSLLNNKDVLDFEYESGLKVFHNLPPLDERQKDIIALLPFIKKMGFKVDAEGSINSKNKLLGLFGL